MVSETNELAHIIIDAAVGIATILLVIITLIQTRHTKDELKITQDQMKLTIRPYITLENKIFAMVNSKGLDEIFNLSMSILNIGNIPANNIRSYTFFVNSDFMNKIDYKAIPLDYEKYEGTLFPNQTDKRISVHFTVTPTTVPNTKKLLTKLNRPDNELPIKDKYSLVYIVIYITYKYSDNNLGKYCRIYSLDDIFGAIPNRSEENVTITISAINEWYE